MNVNLNLCVVENKRHLRSVVKIECGPNEGSAVCVHSYDTGGLLFLTCAHVVQHVRNIVILRRLCFVVFSKSLFSTENTIGDTKI